MHMVGHQAVAQQRQLVELYVFPEEIQIHQTLVIGREQKLPGIAALRHMVRDIYDYDTGKTCHHKQDIRKRPVCPPVPQLR